MEGEKSSRLWGMLGRDEDEERQWLSNARENFQRYKLFLGASQASLRPSQPSAFQEMLTEYLGSAVDCTIKREGCIPKIIHHIWLGSPFPDHLVALRQTWQRHHDSTEWQMQLWDDDAIASFGLMNYEAYNAATNFGEKSDIARYEILYRLGGVYVDTDFECISALDDLHEWPSSRAAPSGYPSLRPVELYTGLANTKLECEVNNGIIGAVPQHPILARAILRIYDEFAKESATDTVIGSVGAANLSAKFTALTLIDSFSGNKTGICADEENRAARTISRTGPGLWTRVVMRSIAEARAAARGSESAANELKRMNLNASTFPEKQLASMRLRALLTPRRASAVLVFPQEWFYPVPNNESAVLQRCSKESERPESRDALKTKYSVVGVTRAIHYWERSWMPPSQHKNCDEHLKRKDSDDSILDLCGCGDLSSIAAKLDENQDGTHVAFWSHPTTGWTGLHAAAKMGRSDVASLLLDRNSKLLFSTTRLGSTPLHIAASQGQNDIVTALLEYCRVRIKRGETNQNVEDGVCQYITMKDSKGNCALHKAAQFGSAIVCRTLILAGADVNSQNSELQTPLDISRSSIEPGHREALAALEKYENITLAPH